MDFLLSAFASKSIKPSAVNKLTASFANDFREGVDINLGVGYVNDQTIPYAAINEASEYVLSHPEIYRSSLNYGGAVGSPNLRKSIKEYYLRNNLGGLLETDFKNRQILIGANGATSLLDSLSDLLIPGVVITSDPFYYIYTEILQNKGFTICPIEEDQHGIIPERIQDALEKLDLASLSFVYIVTVNNPSCSILTNERRKQLVELFAELSRQTGRLIPLIFDKAYEDIIHNPSVEKPVSGLKFDTLGNALEIGTLSKVLAPALRIGYCICSNTLLQNLLVQRTSDIGFSASLYNQNIASWLLDNYIEKQKVQVNKGYRNKAKAIYTFLEQQLSPFIKNISGGDAGFYFYITLNAIQTDENSPFFSFLTRTTGYAEIDGLEAKLPRLVYIPGVICSHSKNARYQFRLSYGFEELVVFEKAIQLIREACEFAIQSEFEKKS